MGGVFFLLALAFVVVPPLLAIVAWVRVRQLEQRVARLEARDPPVADSAPPMPADVARPALAPGQPVASPPAATHIDWEALIGGRWLNRIGLLAVAVGVSYFLKYAIDNSWIGPRGQVTLGVLAGTGLVAWSTSFTRRGLAYFADGLAGLGAAVLYLSLWAGASYHRLLPPNLAFAAMIAVTAAMLGIALARNSPSVAGLAMIGGFLTPWLLSTGRDAQVVLFLYLALHNFALLALARLRDWRFLELPAFAFTELYFWSWYGRFYAPSALGRTALFATLFFSQFSILPIIRVRATRALRQEQAALVVANAAVFLLVLRTLLWPGERWTLTVATLALAGAHLGLARAVPSETEPPARVLFAGLALTFATLAIPIRFEGSWITVAWAIEAGVLVWTGFSTNLRYLRAGAYAIFVAIALRLAADPLRASTFLFNARLATLLIVAASAGASSWLAARFRDRVFGSEPAIAAALAVSANALVIWALTQEVDLYFGVGPGSGGAARDVLLARSLTMSLLWTLYATALVTVGARLGAPVLRWQGLALFGLTTMKVFFVDLASLSGLYRIVSSIALGVVLLVVSFLYQRSLAERLEHS